MRPGREAPDAKNISFGGEMEGCFAEQTHSQLYLFSSWLWVVEKALSLLRLQAAAPAAWEDVECRISIAAWHGGCSVTPPWERAGLGEELFTLEL